MFIKDELDKIKLPDVYRREGKDCYYDKYGKRLIKITQAETVRQKAAGYFELKLGVPREMISLEMPITDDSKSRPEYADIVIYAIDKQTNYKMPMAIVICKREGVPLTEDIAGQAVRYSEILEGRYIAVTNGVEIKTAVYDEESRNYYYIDELLSYEEMIETAAEEYALPDLRVEKFERLSMAELKDREIISDYNDSEGRFFGADTEPVKRSFAVNFSQALYDLDHKLPAGKFKTFEMLKDIGLRYMSNNNAGGGYYEGIYRSFLVKDRFEEAQILSFAIFGTAPVFRGENRASYTSLVVSIDKFKTNHNILQYNIDTHAEVYPKGIMKFKHNGRISSIKSKYVADKVREQGGFLTVSENIIDIGELHINKLLYIDDHEVSGFIYSLIEYALLREEVRSDSGKNR